MYRLFISYRQADEQGSVLAHALYRELRRHFEVFLDVAARSPGIAFPEKLSLALRTCNAMLVVMGSGWLPELRARIDRPDDWVRYEVAYALKRPLLPVVPVYGTGVPHLQVTDLPAELRELVYRESVTMSPLADFDHHVAALSTNLERVLAEQSDLARAEASERKAALTRLARALSRVVADRRQRAVQLPATSLNLGWTVQYDPTLR